MKSESVAAATGIAGRVRALRRASGMTQVELADGRFTKQYVSQIERGEVVPSDELLVWLAKRLGVEPMLDRYRPQREPTSSGSNAIRHGPGTVSTSTAIPTRWNSPGPLRQSLGTEAPRWAYRSAMRGEAWALIRLGKVTAAAELLGEVRATAESGGANDADEQAEIAYLTAVCCYTLSTMAAAHTEFARALVAARRGRRAE